MYSLLKKEVIELTMIVESTTTGKNTGPHTKKREMYKDDGTHITSLFAKKAVNDATFIILPYGALIKNE